MSDGTIVSGPELEALERALAQEREAANRLRGVYAARDRRIASITERLRRAEHDLGEARQRTRELTATAEARDRELELLERELQRLTAVGDQLGGEVAAPGASEGEGIRARITSLELTLDRARRELAARSQERDALAAQLQVRVTEAQSQAERVRSLEGTLAQVRAELSDLRLAAQRDAEALQWLVDERRVLTKHARGLASSRTWRYGHNVARFARTVTFRRSKREAGAAEVLVGILDAPLQLGPGTSASAKPDPR